MKVWEGFVRNVTNLKLGMISARSPVVGMGEIAAARFVASRHRSAGGRNCVPKSTW